MKDFSNYKFRCSQLSSLMSASGKLIDGNKEYLKKIYYSEMKGYSEVIGSKYFEKGIGCEEDGISMLQDTLFKGQLLIKNRERKQNDFINGECDVYHNGIIIDIKNAWDWLTFSNAEMSRNYEWQLIGYMMLWECKESMIYYCLNDLPEYMLIDEIKKGYYKGISEDEVRRNFTVSHYPVEERFKSFNLSWSEDKEYQLKSKVIECREWLNNYHKSELERIENNKKLCQLQYQQK